MGRSARTIRWVVTGVVAALVLATGCAGPAGAPPAGPTRSVTHELGTAEVPVAPRSVVALDELSGLALLSHGITPRVVYTSAGDKGAQAVLADAGAELADVAVAQLPSTEELVARAPDLVVATGPQGPLSASYGEVSRVAPTVVLPVSGQWRDMITVVGERLGDPAGAERQIAAVEARLEGAAGAAQGRVLSLLGNSFGANNFTMPQNAPISALIAEAGFARPTTQQQTVPGYSLPLSTEQIAAQDGDLLVVPAGTYYDADALLASPTAATLRGPVSRPLAEAWFGTTPFAFFVSAGDLRTLATGQGVLSREDAVSGLWREFVAESAA